MKTLAIIFGLSILIFFGRTFLRLLRVAIKNIFPFAVIGLILFVAIYSKKSDTWFNNNYPGKTRTEAVFAMGEDAKEIPGVAMEIADTLATKFMRHVEASEGWNELKEYMK